MVKEFKSIDEKILEQTIREFIRKKEDLKKRVRKIKIKGNGAEQAAKIIFDILKSD